MLHGELLYQLSHGIHIQIQVISKGAETEGKEMRSKGIGKEQRK